MSILPRLISCCHALIVAFDIDLAIRDQAWGILLAGRKNNLQLGIKRYKPTLPALHAGILVENAAPIFYDFRGNR